MIENIRGKQKKSNREKLGAVINTISYETCLGILVLVLMALAGCNGVVGTDSPEPRATVSPTETNHTETETPVSTPPATTTQTGTDTPKFSKEEKYGYFRDGYVEGLEDANVDVINNSLDPENKTLYLTYQMQDPESDLYTGRERENISLRYVAATDFYINGNISELDKTWVPKQVNVTAITPEGELYETAYTTFERARKMIDGEISARRYLLEYYDTIEMGPANPEYNSQ